MGGQAVITNRRSNGLRYSIAESQTRRNKPPFPILSRRIWRKLLILTDFLTHSLHLRRETYICIHTFSFHAVFSICIFFCFLLCLFNMLNIAISFNFKHQKEKNVQSLILSMNNRWAVLVIFVFAYPL